MGGRGDFARRCGRRLSRSRSRRPVRRRRGDGGRRRRLAGQRNLRGGAGLAAGEAAASLLLRLALEIGFLCAARFLLALARFGGFALGLFARFAFAALGGLGLLAPAIFFFLGPSVRESAGARLALFVGERLQDDAGLARRGRRARSADGRAARRHYGRRRGRGLGLNDRRWRRGCDDRGCCPLRPVNAALLLNDHHLAAPVRKALTHRSLFHRSLEV